MNISLLALLTVTIFVADVHAATLGCKVSPAVNKAAREFGFKSGLISKADEAIREFFPVQKWTLVKAVPEGNGCALVMDLCMALTPKDEPICSGAAYEVLALKAGKVVKFQDAFTVPFTLRAGIGLIQPDFHPGPEDQSPPVQGSELPTDLYYVELSGDSALDAMKSIVSKTPYGGFSGTISAKNRHRVNGKVDGDPDGKWDFDPTPERTWKIVEPKYSLRRGNSAEILDVRPIQLDDDFHAYYSGSGGNVAPWAASFIRRYFNPEKGWVDVEIDRTTDTGNKVGRTTACRNLLGE
jgi:hypothetical protein